MLDYLCSPFYFAPLGWEWRYTAEPVVGLGLGKRIAAREWDVVRIANLECSFFDGAPPRIVTHGFFPTMGTTSRST